MKRVVLCAVLALLSGCARPGEKKAERAVEELLPQYLGVAQSYRVKVKAASLGALMRGSRVRVQVNGSLLARGGGATLDFEPDKARLLILPIPKPILDFVAERINPVVDFSALKAPIRVEKAEVKGGSMAERLPAPESVTGLSR